LTPFSKGHRSTDIPHGRIFRVDPFGQWAIVCEYDGWPNGLKITPDGRILITDYKHGLMELDPQRGAISPFYCGVRSESFKGVNDLVIARNGDIYFTDQGQTGMHDPTGRVYRLAVDGRLERLLDNCPSPNGIALDPGEKWLFVALTRACQIWRMPLSPDGVTGKVNVFAQIPGGTSGPDGLAVDEDGGLAIANPGHGCVWVTDKTGVPRWRVKSCAGHAVTNLAFDPKEPNRLVFTESDTGQILEVRLPVRGHVLASHA
jgi:gluconolactonase